MINDQRAARKWQTFIQACLQRRVGSSSFGDYAKVLRRESPAKGIDICKTLVSGPPVNGTDPLLPVYVDQLLSVGAVHPHQLLRVLLEKRRQDAVIESGDMEVEGAANAIVRQSAIEHAVLVCLTKLFTGHVHETTLDMQATLRNLAEWMQDTDLQNTQVILHSALASTPEVAQAILSFREHLAALSVSILSNEAVGRLLQDPHVSKDIPKRLGEALARFIPLISQDFTSLASRLQIIQRENVSLHADNANGAGKQGTQEDDPVVEVDVAAVMDAAPLNTRGGSLVYLDALLDGYPTVTDAALLSYLELRYKGDTPTAVTDLITASFDVLTGAALRREAAERVFIPRTFLVNKVPLLIGMLTTTSFVPVDVEMAVSQALSRLHQTVFPAFSTDFDLDTGYGEVSNVRNEFLFSCTLHGLLQEASIERLVGEKPTQAPSSRSRADKQALIAECKHNSNKLDEMIQATESMDGNAVARAEALSDILQSTCAARDKATLKSLCNRISRRTSCMDALALFTHVALIMRPLCRMLVEWKPDEDQGEHRPVYDEFSACFLLVLAMQHRFQLTAADLGTSEEDSVIRRLVEGRTSELLAGNLTAEQDKHLDGWIGGLFHTEGISDELMSTCPPQEFYEIVPVMFKEMTRACQAHVLDGETLKSGLGLLLETFLIPALVPGMLWIVDQEWDQPGERNIVLLILQRVMRPTSIRGEAVNMHNTILSIVGRALGRFLEEQHQRDPTRNEIEALQERLQGCLDFDRAGGPTMEEIAESLAPHGGSALGHMRANVRGLCYWSSHAAMNASMPTLTHRQTKAATSLVGAKAVLDALLEEIKSQSAAGLADVALDVGAALVFTSVLDLNRSGGTATLGLYEVLQAELHEAPQVRSKDVFRTETLVRLGRRTEALSAAVPATATETVDASIPLADEMLNMAGMGGLDGMGPETSGADALGFGDAATGGLPLDLDASMQSHGASGGGDGADGGLSGGDGAGPPNEQIAAPATEEDIFGDLVLDEDMQMF